MAKFGTTLSQKFLFVLGGAVVFALVLVGTVFSFLLDQYHKTAAKQALQVSFERVETVLRRRDKRLDSIAIDLAKEKDVVSIVNLLNKYQEKQNYQPLIFDTEKKRLARRLAEQDKSKGHSYFAIYSADRELVAYHYSDYDTPGISGFRSYRKDAPVLLARQGSGDFRLVDELPTFGEEIAPAKLPNTIKHSYRIHSGVLLYVDVVPIVRQYNGAPDETIGVLIAAHVLDKRFVEQTSQLIGHALSVQIPGIRKLGPIDLQSVIPATETLPDIFKNPGKFLSLPNSDYYVGGVRIPTLGSGLATLLIGFDKKPFVFGIDTLQKSIFWALVGIAIVVMPFGTFFVRRNLTKPIQQLMAGVDAVSRQETNLIVDLNSKDELGVLGQSFNAMARTIHAREDDLRTGRDQLRQEKDKTEKLLDIAEAIIVELDVTGTVVLINRQGCKLLGFSEKDILGKNWLETFIPEERREDTKAIFSQLISGSIESSGYIENEVIAKNGERRIIFWHNVVQTDDDGNIVGTLSSGQDVTERKEAEEQLHQAQKMEAVGQLTGGVAHDFNNLLAVIQNNAEIIADRTLGDPDLVQMILRSTARGAELTQRLLAFSRQQPLQPRPFDLADLVNEMSDLLKRTLGETIEIEIAADTELWTASADPSQVENALLNLAINARDAMPGGGRLKIDCHNASLSEVAGIKNPEALATDYVVLAVTDNGTGMSPEVREHAFEPFFTTKEVGQGSGLGLSMIYGFAKQSGGQAVISSEEGQGTEVSVYLPRSERHSVVSMAKTPDSPSAGRGEVVLVVEDNDDVRESTILLLETMDYRTLSASHAMEALKILEAEPVDAVLTDVVLSDGMSGKDLAAQAMERYSGIKFIFMSGYSADNIETQDDAWPNQIFIQKPFKLEQLAIALRNALD